VIFLFSNFAEARLSARLGASSEVLIIPASDAARFPVPQLPGERFSAILYDGEQPPEVVWGRWNELDGTITVDRGMENSVARTWLPGTALVHTLTTASIEYFVTSGQQEWLDQLLASIADLQAQINAEKAAREALQADMLVRFGQVYVDLGNTNASVQVVATSFSDMQVSWANYQLVVNSRLDASESLIEQTVQTFNDFETAQASWNLLMESRVGDAETQITQNFTTFTTYESATATTLAGLRADVDDSLAQIQAEQTVRADQNDALASSITTLTATVGDVSGSLTETQLVVADIEGNISTKYGVSLTAGGVFAGFTVMAGTGPAGDVVSKARFAVADFEISTPDGLLVPFSFDTDTGVAYLQNIVVDGALIENLVVNWADIEDVLVTTAQIDDLAVTSAKIDDAAITTAKIGDLQVDTIKIKDFAVTDPENIMTTGELNVEDGLLVTIQSLVVNVSAGERVDILGSFSYYDIRTASPLGSGSGTYFRVALKRNGTTLIDSRFSIVIGGIPMTGVATVPWADEPGAGLFTYTLETYAEDGSVVDAGKINNRYMQVTRVKK
jgi:hypothetical protein